MQIDQKITTEAGMIHFKGEVTEEEFDNIVQMGLLALYLQNKIKASIAQPDGSIVSEGSDTIQ